MRKVLFHVRMDSNITCSDVDEYVRVLVVRRAREGWALVTWQPLGRLNFKPRGFHNPLLEIESIIFKNTTKNVTARLYSRCGGGLHVFVPRLLLTCGATPTPLRTPVYMTRSKMNIHMFYDGRVVQQ